MNLYICGLIDIFLIDGAIIVLVIGYKKGFMKKVLSLVGFLVVIALSFIFCGQISQFMRDNGIIYPGIHDSIYNNVISSEFFAGSTTLNEMLAKGLNIPGFMADMFANLIQSRNPGIDLTTAEGAADAIAVGLGTVAMNVIAWFVIFVGVWLIILILKIFANCLRSNKLIRVIDGILGMALYAVIFFAIVCVLFWILSLMWPADWFGGAREWLSVDMQIGTGSWRLSKTLFENNILTNIWHLFFPA